jgi:hypothetical protein
MKKLHKELRKVAELIDPKNKEQLHHLKSLASACGDFDLAIEIKKIELDNKQDQEEETESVLLVNSIRTPDGTILTSHHRHDFVCHVDNVTGSKYCVDGGNDYRRVIPGGVYVDLSVYSDDPFEKIRESLARLGSGKNFDKPARWFTLNEMSDNWLSELILWIEANQPNNSLKEYYLKEIEYRKENNIKVEEDED